MKFGITTFVTDEGIRAYTRPERIREVRQWPADNGRGHVPFTVFGARGPEAAGRWPRPASSGVTFMLPTIRKPRRWPPWTASRRACIPTADPARGPACAAALPCPGRATRADRRPP